MTRQENFLRLVRDLAASAVPSEEALEALCSDLADVEVLARAASALEDGELLSIYNDVWGDVVGPVASLAPRVVAVDGCTECPFEYDGLTCQHPDTDDAACDAAGPMWAYGNEPPAWCPLRRAPALVELAPCVKNVPTGGSDRAFFGVSVPKGRAGDSGES